MSDFYIKVPSNSSTAEYPNNKPNSFKIRLPEPIHVSSEWKVALTSIALPDTNEVLPEFSPNDEPLFRMRWMYKRPADGQRPDFLTNKEEGFTKDDLSLNFGGLDGVGFMKTMVNFFQNKLLSPDGTANTDVLKGWQLYNNLADGLGYMRFKWSGDELIIDNEETDKTSPNVRFMINKHLCHKMKWIVEMGENFYRLGPNIKMEIESDDTIPNPDAPGMHEDLKEGNDAVFFKKVTVDNVEYYRFSYHCNWRFININAAYSSMIEHPSRTLLVYSDVGSSSVLGNQKVDILREVLYKESGKGVFYFEPTLPQYITVRKDLIDIVEVQVGEVSGELTKFSSGNTILTLHFKHE